MLEPTGAFVGDHAAIGTHEINLAAIGPPGHSASQRYVVVARQLGAIQVRGGILDLPNDGHLLLELRYDELIAVAENDVRGRSRRGAQSARQIDDESADSLCRAELA